MELWDRALFRQCDVSKWDVVQELYQAAWKSFGTIHAVLGNAGITRDSLLKDRFDEKTGRLEPPDLGSLSINLIGQIYVIPTNTALQVHITINSVAPWVTRKSPRYIPNTFD